MWVAIANFFAYLYNNTIFSYISYPIDPLLYDWPTYLPLYILFTVIAIALLFWATQKGRSIRLGKIEWTFKVNMWDFWTMSSIKWNTYRRTGFMKKKEYKTRSFYIKKKAPQGLLAKAERI